MRPTAGTPNSGVLRTQGYPGGFARREAPLTRTNLTLRLHRVERARGYSKQRLDNTEHEHKKTKPTEIFHVGRHVQALMNCPQLVSQHLEHDVNLFDGGGG